MSALRGLRWLAAAHGGLGGRGRATGWRLPGRAACLCSHPHTCCHHAKPPSAPASPASCAAARCTVIVKSSSGPRYVVGCRSKVEKTKLTPNTRVALDVTTLTIMRILPREVRAAFHSFMGFSFVMAGRQGSLCSWGGCAGAGGWACLGDCLGDWRRAWKSGRSGFSQPSGVHWSEAGGPPEVRRTFGAALLRPQILSSCSSPPNTLGPPPLRPLITNKGLSLRSPRWTRLCSTC